MPGGRPVQLTGEKPYRIAATKLGHNNRVGEERIDPHLCAVRTILPQLVFGPLPLLCLLAPITSCAAAVGARSRM